MSPKAKSAAGIARHDDKGVLVIYRFAFAKSLQSLKKFIDHHECAHHQTGDSQTQIQNVQMALRQTMDAAGFPPSTIDNRLVNIDNCARKDNTVVEFIKAILDHHAAN